MNIENAMENVEKDFIVYLDKKYTVGGLIESYLKLKEADSKCADISDFYKSLKNYKPLGLQESYLRAKSLIKAKLYVKRLEKEIRKNAVELIQHFHAYDFKETDLKALKEMILR